MRDRCRSGRLEALQNVPKHAAGASAVVVELSDDGALRFEVRDDGAGYDTDNVTAGVGLTSMHDRLATVGGVWRSARARAAAHA